MHTTTCSQLALSLKIPCFHFRPGRAARMPESLSSFPAAIIGPVENVPAPDTNFVQLAIHIASASAVLPILLTRESVSMCM